MSAKHPIIAVTGSSGAGTSTSTNAFRSMFHQLGYKAAVVEGTVSTAIPGPRWMSLSARREQGRHISYFGPEANDFGCWSPFPGVRPERHRPVPALPAQLRRGGALQPDAGHLHPWQDLPGETDLLFYEGLHGGVVTGEHNVARHVDFLIGVVPIVNLEWIQKLIRDTSSAATPGRR